MGIYLGIDTSNYTSSVSLYDSESKKLIMKKQLLSVNKGEKGLRQSDAVFQHTKILPGLIRELYNDKDVDLSAVGVSVRPRNIEGSYMPCFMVGSGYAEVIAAVGKKDFYDFSHQDGHLMAATFGAGCLDILKNKFTALHVSGGTTEILSVRYENKGFSVKILSKTLDICAGQIIDRIGVNMGLDFPAGSHLEKLAYNANKVIKPYLSVKNNGFNFSGLENKCLKMLSDGEEKENVALFVLNSIYETIDKVITDLDLKRSPILFSGGVMSNSILRKKFKSKYSEAYFAQPEYSSDNAGGIAVLTAFKKEDFLLG